MLLQYITFNFIYEISISYLVDCNREQSWANAKLKKKCRIFITFLMHEMECESRREYLYFTTTGLHELLHQLKLHHLILFCPIWVCICVLGYLRSTYTILVSAHHHCCNQTIFPCVQWLHNALTQLPDRIASQNVTQITWFHAKAALK